MTASKNEDFFGDILDWEYPKRHTSKSDDYISFKAKDPVTGKLRQKKYSLMQYAKGNERDMMAGQMTANLLRRLQGGWNPFVPDIENRSGTLFTEVTAEYRKTLKVEESKGVKKPKTVVDYCSRLKQFESWAMRRRRVWMRWCSNIRDGARGSIPCRSSPTTPSFGRVRLPCHWVTFIFPLQHPNLRAA